MPVEPRKLAGKILKTVGKSALLDLKIAPETGESTALPVEIHARRHGKTGETAHAIA
jgi:hypothetical protein